MYVGSQRGLSLSAEIQPRAQVQSVFRFYRNCRRKGPIEHREPCEQNTTG